jgi:hypothetical protein
MDAWEAALDRSGLPLMRVGRGPARIGFAAPLPVGMAAERELAEIQLTERCEVWRVREALVAALPDGWRLVSLDDVWLGAPSLSGLVAGADYRIELGIGEADASVIEPGAVAGPAGPGRTAAPAPDARPETASATSIGAAAAALVRAPTLPRERAKGGGVVAYDLRPLLLDVQVVDAGPPIVVRARTRLHPSLGSGRPEEVVAALRDELGIALFPKAIIRERVLLSEELE